MGQGRIREEVNLGDFIQNIIPTQQENLNYEDIYEAFYQLYQNPIDLNSANREELATLYLLSEAQINSFLAYRQQFGKLLSIYELQAVPDFDITSIRKILPFVEVQQRISIGKATEHYLILRCDKVLEPQKGYVNQQYMGSQMRTYLRYRLAHSKDFSVGFIAEKDPGETNYADFYSGHLLFKNKGAWKNIVLGDYQIQIGQGLISSSGYFIGKGSETINTIRRSHLGIRPYNSIIEGGFFRGGAATYLYKNIALTSFFSATKHDATLSDNNSSKEEYASSLLASGYHRTQSEIDRKNNIAEQSIGFDATLNYGSGQAGLSALQTSFDTPLKRQDSPYNLFEFAGKQNLLLGGHFTHNWQNINFFGEIARSSSGGTGVVAGLLAALNKRVELAMLFRKYDKDFHSFYANSFAENSRSINEQGLYWGIKYSPRKSLVFSAYYDQFRFPWLKYLVSSPSAGFDYLFKIAYQPNKRALFSAQFREERKEKNLSSNSSKTEVLAGTIRQNIVLNFDYNPTRSLRSQTRLALNRYGYAHNSLANGYALIQDIETNIKKWQFKGRVAYFKTDNYDTRVYAFENDVLYSVSFPAYYETGIRAYFIFRRSLSEHLDIWARIAQTRLFNQKTIGSGNDMIDVPHKTELKLQLRWKI